MALVGINLFPRVSFLMQSDWSIFFSNQSLCIRKYWEQGWVDKLNKNSFPMVGSRESSS